MGRSAVLLVAIVIVVFAAEWRLSDGEPNAVQAPPPELWQEVRHLYGAPSSIPSLNCPLVLSLDPASPYRFTSVDGGVRFDIDDDGDPEQVAWTEQDSDVAFLALDRNGDGRITSGGELISGRTRPGTGNGPNALIEMANDAAGGEGGALLDHDNPLFSKLLVWNDRNHNGVSEPDELRPADAVVAAIGLGFGRHHRRDRHGNESRYRGFVRVRTEPFRVRPQTPQHDRERTRPMYDACVMAR